MKREYLYIAVIVILVILIFIAIFNSKNNTKSTNSNIINSTTTNTNNNKTIPSGKVGIVSHKYDGYGNIEVVIKNNTGKEIKMVIVSAECWDKEGNNLGIKKAGKYNINTKDTYKITIACGTDMKKYNLKLEYE